ncbi:hypothetical protein SCUP234_05122 [Seiridium cupressi]
MATSNNIISLRRHDLDNLRTFLTSLVTVHHTSITYSGTGSWPFKSAIFADKSALILGFNMCNQSFFMGLFFWISGRVSAQSLEKSPHIGGFIRNKIMRLGVPTLLYTLVVTPLVRFMVLSSWDADYVRTFLQHYYTTLRSVRGPIWYTATLLSFDIIAACIRKASGSTEKKGVNSNRRIIYEQLKRYGWLAVAVCSFLSKAYFPFGTMLPIIGMQPTYSFQYIYAYTLGYLSQSYGDQIMKGAFDPSSTPVKVKGTKDEKIHEVQTSSGLSLPIAVVISLLSINFIFLPRYLDSVDWLRETMAQLFGGWTMPSLLYAFWNEFSFHLVGPALMSYFQQWYNKPTILSTWNARYSYAAFLVHEPLSVAMEILVEKALLPVLATDFWMKSQIWQNIGPAVMTVSVGLTSAWASSFAGKKLLEWIPSLKKII